jgi:hypothetical protein
LSAWERTYFAQRGTDCPFAKEKLNTIELRSVPIGFQGFSYLRLDEQIFSLDLHEPGTHGPLSRTTKYGARDHVELAAVARARHSRAIQLALRERAPHMGARVIEGMQMSECPCDAHLGSRDIEDAHLVLYDILCITNFYHHDFTS